MPYSNLTLQEYGVKGWAIAQCEGDVVFIPAGAPHQVIITRMLKVLKLFLALTKSIRISCYD